jgi:hypothetical protein
LIDIIYQMKKNEQQMQDEIASLQEELQERRIRVSVAGSIAEASLQLSGIFTAAQDSCQYYLENVKLLSERQAKVCQQMEEETKEKCERMVAEAELKSQQCWENCSVKIRELVESFEGLQQAMDVYAAITRRPTDASNQIGGRMC